MYVFFFLFGLSLFVLFELFSCRHSIVIFTEYSQDLKAFKQVLKTMWFAKYAKGNSVNQYSGFEHTFVGKDILSLSP